jgi:hypothetical protein
LTWIFARRRDQRSARTGSLFVPALIPVAIAILVLLAFVEEGLWNGLVWREHLALFPGFEFLPHVEGFTPLSLLVPLLAVPQVTHYVLDGVIWRLRTRRQWSEILFWRPEPRA